MSNDIKVVIDRHNGDCETCGSWISVGAEVEIFGKTYSAYEDDHLGGETENDFPLSMYEPEVSVKDFILNKLVELHGYNLTIEDNDYDCL